MRREHQKQADATFVEFMVAAQPSLLRLGYFLTGSQDQARELTQEALVRAYSRWPKIQQDGALAYTRKILANLRVDRARHDWRERPTDQLMGDVEPAADTVEDRHDLVALLRQLPERQRKVVVLRYCCDLSEREVANTLGISVGGVKSQASRGLAALRALSVATEGERS